LVLENSGVRPKFVGVEIHHRPGERLNLLVLPPAGPVAEVEEDIPIIIAAELRSDGEIGWVLDESLARWVLFECVRKLWDRSSYAPPVVIQQQPLTYTQQQAQPAQPAPQAQQAYYWYYCADAKAYYPYVQQCPAGWLKVVPQTAPPGQ